MTDTSPKRCIILARVSSEEQASDSKMSIPDQLSRQRERAAANGWLIVDEIIVEGFSADYWTYAEYADDAAKHGFFDPLRMWDHWRLKDFDILSCRDLSRLGREQSILNEVIGRTMKAGATIVPLDEASVDSVNYRMTGAIAGLGAAAHLDNLKRGRDMGQRGHASRGEKLGNRVPLFYLMGDKRKLSPDRVQFQRFFDDLYELFTAGVSYEQIPAELEARGHIHPVRGSRYSKEVIRRLLITARTWGHGEYNRKGIKRGKSSLTAETWCTGRGQPPSDVFFVLDVFEPIWSGQQREDMIDELERRFYAIRGAARPYNTYAFSSLCVCDVCGTPMIVQVIPHTHEIFSYMKCPKGRLHKDCTNNLGVRFEKIQDLLTETLHTALDNPAVILAPTESLSVDKLPGITRDLSKAQNKLNNLIELIGEQEPSARPDFQAKIEAARQQRDALRAEKARYEYGERTIAHKERSRLNAMDELRALGVNNFWLQPTTKQNQLLRKILGSLRVAANNGDAIGLKNVG